MFVRSDVVCSVVCGICCFLVIVVDGEGVGFIVCDFICVVMKSGIERKMVL